MGLHFGDLWHWQCTGVPRCIPGAASGCCSPLLLSSVTSHTPATSLGCRIIVPPHCPGCDGGMAVPARSYTGMLRLNCDARLWVKRVQLITRKSRKTNVKRQHQRRLVILWKTLGVQAFVKPRSLPLSDLDWPLCHGTGAPPPPLRKNENNALLQKDAIHLEWRP